MKFSEVYALLKRSGLDVGYYQWEEKQVPPLPYILYYFPNMDPEAADNANYASIYQLNVELYTKNKDFELEANLDTVLTDGGMVFRKEETYIDSERMYEVLYTMEVLIDG